MAGRHFPLAIRHPREGRSHPPPGFFSRAPRGRILLLGSPSVTTGIRATAGFPAAKALLLAGPRRSTVRSGPWPRRRAVPDTPTRKGWKQTLLVGRLELCSSGAGEASRWCFAASRTCGDGPGSGEEACSPPPGLPETPPHSTLAERELRCNPRARSGLDSQLAAQGTRQVHCHGRQSKSQPPSQWAAL